MKRTLLRQSGWHSVGLCILISLQLAVAAFGAAPAFVQEIDNQVGSGQNNSVTFPAPTTAGNLLAVYLIWDNTGTAAVTDSLGDSYASAVPPIRWSNGSYSAQIFYTISVRGGANTVTATFANGVTQFGIVYAHEYSGINQSSPIDAISGAVGTSGSLNSGAVTTANAVDLLFAGGVSEANVLAPGAGYTVRSNAEGNMTEDQVVSATGSYTATATNSSGGWGMQLVAFKGASAGGTTDTTPPSVPTGLSAIGVSSSQVNLSWNASTDPDNPSGQLTYGVFRNGARIGTTAAGTTSWADSGLTGSTTYFYTVSALDPAGNSSGQSSAVSATTLSAPNNTPTIPTNLRVTATTTSSVSLAWNASTDNIGVAGYSIYRSGAQIAVSASTVYTDSGLSPSTNYSSAVLAFDAAGNFSGMSAPVSATTNSQQAQLPTVSIISPANNQTVSGVTTVAANATSSVGVAGVQFQLDGANLGAEVTNPPYVTSWNTNPTANGPHVLTALVFDSAGNRGVSSGVTVTVSNSSGHSYSTNFPLSENPISEGGNWINGGQSPALSWTNMQTVPGLAFGTMPPFSSDDSDSVALLTGNWGPDQTVTATVQAGGDFANGLEAEILLRGTFGNNATTAYELVFAAGYIGIVRLNGALDDNTILAINTSPDWDLIGATITGTISGGTITAYVNGVPEISATDTAIQSGSPGMGAFTSDGGDPVNSDLGFTSFSATDGASASTGTTPPTTPANLTATVISASEIDLRWSASSDDVGVAGYHVFRNNTQIATTTSTNFADVTVIAGVLYTYTVSAFDAAGNTSPQSAAVQATASLSTDTTPPTVPTGLKVTGTTTSSVSLSWTSSTDNVAVAGYKVFRSGAQVGISATNSYVDSGLPPSSTFSYTVSAYDAAGNNSLQSTSIDRKSVV